MVSVMIKNQDGSGCGPQLACHIPHNFLGMHLVACGIKILKRQSQMWYVSGEQQHKIG